MTRIFSASQAEHARQRRAQAVGHLRRGPHGRLRRPHVGDRAGRRQGGVALARPEIGGRQLPRGAGHGRVDAAAIDDRLLALDGALAEIGLEVGAAGQSLPGGPRRLELARGADRGPLVLRNDRQEALQPNDADAWQMGDRGLVHGHQARADRRRAQDARVEHARDDGDPGCRCTAGALRGTSGRCGEVPTTA